jgi:toxin-antitoxin system PIN domain toxin
MRALLDVNVLIALLDPDHSMHEQARKWFASNVSRGWASCPITQNGCVRIMSHPAYPNALPTGAVIERLGEAIATVHHQFWPDDVSLLDSQVVERTRIHGPRQLTDVYLLALVVRHQGRFVSFDDSIPLSAIRGAAKRHVVTL